MTLNVNEPTDQILVSELPGFIRQDRAAINAVSGGSNVGFTALTVAPGTVNLSVGTDLGVYGFEVVKVTGAGAATLTAILGGTEGQVKVFIFQDGAVHLIDGPKSNGQFYLNRLPALSDFEPEIDDVLALVNIGGDGGVTTDGYWKELYRSISVK